MMTETQITLERPSIRVLEGTPAEITAYLATAPQETKFKILVSEETETAPQTETPPHAGMTFAEILAPAQQGFEGRDLTADELEELDDFIEAEIKAYRAEKRAEAQAA